jgi:hypothetical protein
LPLPAANRTRDRLIEDLRLKSFRHAADRRNFSAHTALAEASRNALADIGDRVGGASVHRSAAGFISRCSPFRRYIHNVRIDPIRLIVAFI